MADETSKQMVRRSADHRFATRWIVGDGIDIGCGKDPLSKFSAYFPLMKRLRPWDLPDGDAMLMDGVESESYDFVHSSHCLEHLNDPSLAIRNWLRICKPGGYLIITVPDEDLYEQGVWPSTFNADHKWTFTISKQTSWSPKSISIFKFIERFVSEVEVIKIEKLDAGFQYNLPRHDQTLGPLSESAIELVLRKRGRSQENASPGGQDVGSNFSSVVKRQQIGDLFAKAVRNHVEGRLEDARLNYALVLDADPENLGALNNLALILDPAASEKLLCRALEIDGNYFDALLNIGSLLQRTLRTDAAIPYLQRAYRANPKDVRSVLLLGQIYEATDDVSAITEWPTDMRVFQQCAPSDYVQLAKYCESANLPDAALQCLDLALKADNGNAEAHIYRGRQLLKKGLYQAGAEEMEWIWHGRLGGSQIGLFVRPDGTLIGQDGKVIVLSSDSGLGDSIQFVRYVRELKKLGATVIVECQKELVRLFESLDGVDYVIENGALAQNYDVRIPFHNLLGAFRTTIESIPNESPYLRAPTEELASFRKKMKQYGKGFRVGLFWSGNSSHPRNGSRSIPIEVLSRLVGKMGVVSFSLQKENTPSMENLIDMSESIRDMASTAALVENMDLVIAVDSSVAHLAGALGKPTWLLNRFDACWRWGMGEELSPWYPSMRQFRQDRPGDWSAVIDRVEKELLRIAKTEGR